MSIVKLSNVKSGYGKMEIVKGIDLEIEKGSITTLIGPNGAGKSTVLKTILGLTTWREGKIQFEKQDISNFHPADCVKAGISFVHQGRGIFPSLTIDENLDMGAYIVEDKERIAKDKERIYNMFPILEEKKNDIAKSMSGGQQQMLALGRALMLEPKLLMLDEPSIGLAPKITDEIFDKIREINKQGITILMVEQNVQKALEVSNIIHVLVLGQVKYSGTSKEITQSEALRKAYLGK